MYLEKFLKNIGNRGELKQALSILEKIGFFNVMLERAQMVSGTLTADENIIQTAAIQRGISIGYFQAVTDLFHLTDDYKAGTTEKVQPDYGAIEALKNMGLTKKEIEHARSRAHSS